MSLKPIALDTKYFLGPLLDGSYKLEPDLKESKKLQTLHSIYKRKNTSDKKNWRFWAYSLAAIGHLVSIFPKLFNKSTLVKDTFDDYSLNFSKLVHSLSYGTLAFQAFQDNRSLDCIAKILDPLISNFSSLEDMNLMKGISGGINGLDFSHAHLVPKEGFLKNLYENFKASKKMFVEIFSTNPFSKNRKILVPREQESGHTLAASSYLILLSSVLGLTIKPMRKYFNIFRNIGAILANTVSMYHPDKQKNLAGILFNVYASLDMLQRFLPQTMATIVNNINMALYNIGIYYYGDLSNKRTLNKYEHYD